MPLYFANPWGLWALLSIPAIAAIHLYQRRYPVLNIAGLHLWGLDSQIQSPGRTRDRLPITLTLILELLAALLISLAIADPRVGDLGRVAHWIIVLDSSASMSAHPPNQPTFREQAIQKLSSRFAESSRKQTFTIIQTGLRPTMVAGPQVEWDQVEKALKSWNPTEPQHDPASAWDLAVEIAESTGQILYLTDTLPDADQPVPKSMESISVGRRLDNFAFASARWRVHPVTLQGRIALRISNFGRQKNEVEIVGVSNEQTLVSQKITIPGGGTQPIEFVVPGGLGSISVTLKSPADALAIDNTLLLIEPKFRIVRYWLSLPDSPAKQAIEKVLALMPDVTQVDSREQAALWIDSAGELPPSNENRTWLGVGPVNPSEAAMKESKDLVGPFVIEKKHPLMAGVSLEGIIWSGAQPLKTQVTPIVSAGNSTLLGQLVGTRTEGYLLNLDLARSNIRESPDWPILISNLVEHVREQLPGLRQWNFHQRETIRLSLDHPADTTRRDAKSPAKLILKYENTERELDRETDIEIQPLTSYGRYELFDGTTSLGQFAVNFMDPGESNLAGLTAGQRSAENQAATGLFPTDQPYTWLLFIAIACIVVTLLVNWSILSRRPRASMAA